MQFLIVRKSFWRRRVGDRFDDCRRWSVKVRNKSSKWVRVITTDAATGFTSNYCGLGAGDKGCYYCDRWGPTKVDIQISGAAHIVLEWDFDSYNELVLFDNEEEFDQKLHV